MEHDDHVVVPYVLLLLNLLVVSLAVAEQRPNVVHNFVVVLFFVNGARTLLPITTESSEIALKVFDLDHVSQEGQKLLVERVILFSRVAE